MIFISGINDKEKDLEYREMLVCPDCGAMGNARVIMVYRNLSLFFIPTFSWKRRYYVEMSCCNSVFSIDKDLGEEIRRGNTVILEEKDLVKEEGKKFVTCKYCNHALEDGFNYCPNCGRGI